MSVRFQRIFLACCYIIFTSVGWLICLNGGPELDVVVFFEVCDSHTVRRVRRLTGGVPQVSLKKKHFWATPLGPSADSTAVVLFSISRFGSSSGSTTVAVLAVLGRMISNPNTWYVVFLLPGVEAVQVARKLPRKRG